MSRKLLERLNGRRQGAFAAWLAAHPGEPRIAWYPSAGSDFSAPTRLADARWFMPEAPPDLYLHTDYAPRLPYDPQPGQPVGDWDAQGRLKQFEELDPLPAEMLGLDGDIVAFPEGNELTGRVFFLELEFPGTPGTVGVLYLGMENAAFYHHLAHPCRARFSHVFHVRYGHSLGGGISSGSWLLNILGPCRAELFVSDHGFGEPNEGDLKAEALYPSVRKKGAVPARTEVPGLRCRWSDLDTSWYRLSRPRSSRGASRPQP